MEKNIVCVGTLRPDIYYRTDIWPSLGAKAVLEPIGVEAGGSISNAACVFSALGEQCSYFDVLPDDDESRKLAEGLVKYGVDVSTVRYKEGFHGSSCMIALCGGEKTILEINYPKPLIECNEADTEMFKNADCIYCEFSALEFIKGYFELLEKRKSGALLALDIEYPAVTTEQKRLLEMGNILFFNEYGFVQNLNGRSEEEFVGMLLREQAKVVVVTMGKRGSRIYTGGGSFSVESIETVVVDTTGAGDTYNAVFTSEYLKNSPLDMCAHVATAAAAICVSKLGARAGAISCDEAQALLNNKF